MGENFEVWKTHFINQARGLIPHEKIFYRVSEQKGKGNEEKLKIVTPTQQIVERAKSNLSDPPVVYDPVTGITNQPNYEENKFPKVSRKRKYVRKSKQPPPKKKKKKITKKRIEKKKKKKSTKKWYDD
jgi:hypothetical protein